MPKRRTSSLSLAVTLCCGIGLAQLAAFGVLGCLAWQDLSSRKSTPMRNPLLNIAQVFRGELVYPVYGQIYNNGTIPSKQLLGIRAVDLKTGSVREIEGPNLPFLYGIATNGERFWCLGPDDVFEFDGTSLAKHQTKGVPLARDQSSIPFIFENRLAQIDRDIYGNNRLRVLVDNEWQIKAQIAIPGENRAWTIDEESGNSVIVPRTAANWQGNVSTWWNLQVVQINGEYHLFQSDGHPPVGNKRASTLSYRVDFDFVPKGFDGEPISALAPENTIAETTGWVQLDSTLAANFSSVTTSNSELLLTSGNEIWRQISADKKRSPPKFESVVRIDGLKPGAPIHMVSSTESRQIYLIGYGFNYDMEVFRLDEGQLQKLPIQIDGNFPPFARWIAKLLLQGLVVVGVGTLLLIGLAAFWTGRTTYAFGHDSVVLASLVRRSLARCVDQCLIFGPLTLHSIWIFVFHFQSSLFEFLSLENLNQLSPLILSSAWVVVAWIVIVVSTGIGGITPGKWLCGVRVVRTTLRPCGISHALLRELLVWVDVPQFLTAIPGVFCMVATENRQRIGDWIADTLVIEVRP